VSAHRVISRIEIEHASHGGSANGNLPVTKQNFMDYGIHHDAVAPAIREAEALGFIRMKRGRGGNAEHRQPNRFFLTFALGNGPRALTPTHDWRKIKTLEEAEAIAERARAAKDPRAVRFARNRETQTKNRSRKPGPKPVPKTRTENTTSPVPETRTTGQSRKPGPLSISRGGGWGCAAGSVPKGKGKHPPADRPECHTRESLMVYVANVVEEVLDEHDRRHQDARQRLRARLREQSLFDPVNRYVA
jgi:DNA-binding transcriptional MocR family regulator